MTELQLTNVTAMMVLLDVLEAIKDCKEAGGNSESFLKSYDTLKEQVDSFLIKLTKEELNTVMSVYTLKRAGSTSPWLQKLPPDAE